MDALIVLVVSLVLLLLGPRTVPMAPVDTVEVAELNPTLNTDFYHDEGAFMVVANELGFY